MPKASFLIGRGEKKLTELLSLAEGNIDIVSFQFTSEKLARIVKEKLNKGAQIKILTLPPDSYREPERRHEIEKLFQGIQDSGGLVEFCEWEIGDPSLTSTSLSGRMQEGGGTKWYSLHSKFFVSNNLAVMTSANMTDSEEVECFLIFIKPLSLKYKYL